MKFVQYNANDKNKSTDDCVRRALSLAYNLDYKDVRKELNQIAKELNDNTYQHSKVITEFINRHGYQYIDEAAKGLTVDEYSIINPIGIYILDLPKHLTCMIDSTIFDLWDCSKEVIRQAYVISKEAEQIDVHLLLADYKDTIRSKLKKTLSELFEVNNIQAKADKIQVNYINKSTEEVTVGISYGEQYRKVYTNSFLLKVSYRNNIEKYIEEWINNICNKIIKELKNVYNL